MYESLQVDRSSTVERVAEELRRALFDGELAPGTPLREVALAEAMQVSRSTIREALWTLVNEGLVTRAPNRGVSVTAMSRADVRDVCRARAALELAGVRSWPDATAAAKSDLRAALHDYAAVADTVATGGRAAAGTRDLTAAHLAVHRALVGLTGSTRLVGMADSLAAEIRLALAHVDRVRGNAAEQVAEHSELIDRLEAGKVDTVVAELSEHLAHAEESLVEAVGRRPGGRRSG